MISHSVNNVSKMSEKSFTAPINSYEKTASSPGWSFSVVWINSFRNKSLAYIGPWLIGAGGLGIGMDLSGFVETKYAIEFSPSAAKTYKSLIKFCFNLQTDFCVDIITRKLWFIVKTLAHCSNTLLHSLITNIPLLCCQMTEKPSVLTCLIKMLLSILYLEACIFYFYLR